MTSNAAADEIQQIIKSDRAMRNDIIPSEVKDAEIVGSEKEKHSIYEDEYAGAIKFLESPINENFLTDIREQLRIEFEKSFRNLKEYDFLEKEIKKANSLDIIRGAIMANMIAIMLKINFQCLFFSTFATSPSTMSLTDILDTLIIGSMELTRDNIIANMKAPIIWFVVYFIVGSTPPNI